MSSLDIIRRILRYQYDILFEIDRKTSKGGQTITEGGIITVNFTLI